MPSYRFHHQWFLPADREDVFGVLADVGGYPRWWPQVRAVARVDGDTAHVVARSLLPYSLDMLLVREVEDRTSGVLEVSLRGQLEGWSRWTLRGSGAGTAVRYEQEVVTKGRALAAGSRMMRPALVANHTWMMRGGRRGLVKGVRALGGSSAR